MRLRRAAERGVVNAYWYDIPPEQRTGSKYLNRRLVDAAHRQDQATLADFALSVLPDDVRPVAMERGGECGVPGWIVDGECYYGVDCCCQHCVHPDVSVFATKEEADLEAHWNQLKNILAGDRDAAS